MTCVLRTAGFNPSRVQTCVSTRGARWAWVPTAPLSLPTATRARVCRKRSSARPNSSYIKASFSPNVIGSAWMPWLRPIIGTSLKARARSAVTARNSARSARSRSQAAVIWTASVVSRMSEEVSPWWIQRAAGPT